MIARLRRESIQTNIAFRADYRGRKGDVDAASASPSATAKTIQTKTYGDSTLWPGAGIRRVGVRHERCL